MEKTCKINLEGHLVRLVTLLQREFGREVLLEEWSLVDRCDYFGIHSLLQLLTGIVDGGLLVLLLWGLWLLEEVIVDVGRHSQPRDVDLGLGANHIGLWHTTQRHTINCIWSSDEQQTAVELLEENDTGALEATSQQDQHRPLRNALLQLGLLAVVVVVVQLLLHILRWVVAAGLLRRSGDAFSLRLPGFAHAQTGFARRNLHPCNHGSSPC